MGHMTHQVHGQAADPHAGHKMSGAQASHDRHAGHSVAMFRDKFRSHNSSGLLVDRCPTLAWLHSALLSWFNLDRPSPRNGRLRLRRPRFHPWGVARACGTQARHDDPHQPGDHSCLWYIARRNIRPFRHRSLVGTRISDYDHGPRPLARNASYFPGAWRAQCTRRAAPRHCRTSRRCRDSNCSAF